MMKFAYLYSLLTLFPFIGGVCGPVDFPERIDFGSFQLHESHFYDSSDTWTGQLGAAGFEIGLTAFNGAPELGAFFSLIKKRYQIGTVVETGTFKGATTRFFARCFPEVHTVEVVENLYLEAKESFQDQPHVHCHLGSSEKVLNELLPMLQDQRVAFYLDAHWYNYWPIFDELKAIGRTHRDNCIVVIDDIKVPGRPDLGYDAYSMNGVYYECSLDYIQFHLHHVFSEFSVHYLIPEHKGSRAKLVLIPKVWGGL